MNSNHFTIGVALILGATALLSGDQAANAQHHHGGHHHGGGHYHGGHHHGFGHGHGLGHVHGSGHLHGLTHHHHSGYLQHPYGYYDFYPRGYYLRTYSYFPSRPGDSYAYAVPPQFGYYGGELHSHDHTASDSQRSPGPISRADELAVRLVREANSMCLELHHNYQHNPGFKEIYRRAYEVLSTAKYLHDLEHSGSREKLMQSVAELDASFRNLQQDVATWTAHRHRQIGYGGLQDKFAAVDTTLGALMGELTPRRAAVPDEPVPPSDPAATIGLDEEPNVLPPALNEPTERDRVLPPPPNSF